MPIYPATRGNFITELITSPAAGSNFIWPVPDRTILKLHSLTLLITCAAAAANREVEFYWTIQGGQVGRVLTGITHTAGTVAFWTFQSGLSLILSGTAGDFLGPLPPDLLLQTGDAIISSVVNLQPLDTLTAIRLYYEQWIDPS